jgi:hypothetical protein
MISIIKAAAKLCVVVAAMATFLRATPSYAETPYYASNTGSGSSCTFAQPCPLYIAIGSAGLASGTGRVICLGPIDGTANSSTGLTGSGNQTTEVICPQGAQGGILSTGANQTLRINGLTLLGIQGGLETLRFLGSGTLILENCAFVDGTAIALDLEPNGPLNVVIKNSRISNNSSVGIILKPASGGSINATFDHVTVTENGAAGIRLDTTNGPVTADLTDSVIFNNAGNGFGVTSGAGQAVVSITRSVIAKNGGVGVAANGPAAGVMIDATLLDSNATATSVASGGHILTYGNNRIVGPAGSGFTGTATLQ